MSNLFPKNKAVSLSDSPELFEVLATMLKTLVFYMEGVPTELEDDWVGGENDGRRRRRRRRRLLPVSPAEDKSYLWKGRPASAAELKVAAVQLMSVGVRDILKKLQVESKISFLWPYIANVLI